ncbi:hypothetical protein [Actinomycetospora sp. CA-053990]|uniref:hypothetical protein n=1 Tax=Actinomycetospora sp. CA-053990 TaxID=3239891 RepID=UPI003D89B1AF
MSTEMWNRSTRLDAVVARRRHLDGQVTALQTFERRLAERVHTARTAPGAPDRLRELLARLRAVRARLQEAELARAEAVEAESRLREDARDERAELERARREVDEREEFRRACLEAPTRRLDEHSTLVGH